MNVFRDTHLPQRHFQPRSWHYNFNLYSRAFNPLLWKISRSWMSLIVITIGMGDCWILMAQSHLVSFPTHKNALSIRYFYKLPPIVSKHNTKKFTFKSTKQHHISHLPTLINAPPFSHSMSTFTKSFDEKNEHLWKLPWRKVLRSSSVWMQQMVLSANQLLWPLGPRAISTLNNSELTSGSWRVCLPRLGATSH